MDVALAAGQLLVILVFAFIALQHRSERRMLKHQAEFWKEKSEQWESLYRQMSNCFDKTYAAAQSLSESNKQAQELIEKLTL